MLEILSDLRVVGSTLISLLAQPQCPVRNEVAQTSKNTHHPPRFVNYSFLSPSDQYHLDPLPWPYSAHEPLFYIQRPVHPSSLDMMCRLIRASPHREMSCEGYPTWQQASSVANAARPLTNFDELSFLQESAGE